MSASTTDMSSDPFRPPGHHALVSPILKAGILPLRASVMGLLKVSDTIRPKPAFKPADERLTYPSTGGRQIPVHLYLPASYANIVGRLPICVNIPGGGFCFDVHGMSAEFCRRVADEVGCAVLDIDHRHAPEHPWPAALHDIINAVRWAEREAGPRGWDASRICLSGFGAGGCFAFIAASGAIPELRGRFLGVVGFYFLTDLSQDCYNCCQKMYKKSTTTGSVPQFMTHFLARCYLPNGIDRRDPTVSPLFSDPAGFPRSITVITCEKDSLTPEALELAERLKGAGKDVETFVAFGQGHGWDVYARGTKTRSGRLKEKAYSLAVDRLRESMWPGKYVRVNLVSEDAEILAWNATASKKRASMAHYSKRLSKLPESYSKRLSKLPEIKHWQPVHKLRSFFKEKRQHGGKAAILAG